MRVHSEATPIADLKVRPQSLWSRLFSSLTYEYSLARRPRIESSWSSQKGHGHDRNQDSVHAGVPLYAVADGVGGGKGGELASSLMLEFCGAIPIKIWKRKDRLAERLRQADDALVTKLRVLCPDGPSATTFAGVWVQPNGKCTVAHVGDVRVIALRNAGVRPRLDRLTIDQTYDEVGEIAPPGGSQGDPARMIGVGVMGIPPINSFVVGEDDVLVICSDGFHRFVSDISLSNTLADGLKRKQNLQSIARQLTQEAQFAGSHDDISVVLVRLNRPFGAHRTFWVLLSLACLAAMAAYLYFGFPRS